MRLKQIKNMSLGDAIIAGTALVYDLTVVRHAILMIFSGLINYKVLNPFDNLKQTLK